MPRYEHQIAPCHFRLSDPRKSVLLGQLYPVIIWGMDANVSLGHRFRQTIVMLVAALVTAAAVRHFAHVGGGLSREEIRTWALVGAGALIGVLFAILVFRRQR